jgi:hypothetical protein
MSPKILLTSAALVYVIIGIVLLFFPDEIVMWISADATAVIPLQLTSAGLLSLAMLNWTGRSAIYGGIYGRPILLANLMFTTIFSATLIRAVSDKVIGSAAWGLVVLFSLLVLAFFILMRSPPWSSNKTSISTDI